MVGGCTLAVVLVVQACAAALPVMLIGLVAGTALAAVLNGTAPWPTWGAVAVVGSIPAIWPHFRWPAVELQSLPELLSHRLRADDRRARPVDLDRQGGRGALRPGHRREPRVPRPGPVEHRRRLLLVVCVVRLAEPLDAEPRGRARNAAGGGVRVALAAAARRGQRAAAGADPAAGDRRRCWWSSRGRCSTSPAGARCGATAAPTSRSPRSPRWRP